MTPAALYHRVSTRDQDPTLARAELRRGAEARGFQVVLDLEETGSGARNDRPKLQEVMKAARYGSIGAVLVWKLDRFGRSVVDVVTNIRALRSCGCWFICVSQGIDVSAHPDAVTDYMLTMLAAASEFERELIRERTMLGLERVRREGSRSGKPIGRPRRLDTALVSAAMIDRNRGRSLSAIARSLKVPRSTLRAALAPYAAARALERIAR